MRLCRHHCSVKTVDPFLRVGLDIVEGVSRSGAMQPILICRVLDTPARSAGLLEHTVRPTIRR